MCQPRRPCGRSALQRGLETGRRSQGLREFLPCGRKAAHIRGQRTIGGGKSPEPAGGWTGGLGPAGSPSPPGPARSPSSTNTPQSILGRQGLLFPHQKKKKPQKTHKAFSSQPTLWPVKGSPSVLRLAWPPRHGAGTHPQRLGRLLRPGLCPGRGLWVPEFGPRWKHSPSTAGNMKEHQEPRGK